MLNVYLGKNDKLTTENCNHCQFFYSIIMFLLYIIFEAVKPFF